MTVGSATIVIATNGRTSLLNAYRELARRLRAAGHRVTFVTEAGVAERLVADGEGRLGHEIIAIEHDRRFAAEVDADPPPSPTRPLALARWLRGRRRLRARSIDGSEIAAAVESAVPDLVVLDAEFQVGILATADLPVPRALAMTFFSVFSGPDLPPLHTSLGSPTTPTERRRITIAWRRARVGAVVTGLRRRWSRGGLAALLRPMPLDSNDPADLRALARRCRVDLGEVADRGQWLRPYLVRELPVLCLNPAELDLPHRRPARLRYLGPLIRLDRNEPRLSGHEQARWDRLVDARRSSGRPRPLVYATLGTFALDDRRLLDTIVAAFADRPEWDLVIGLGGVVEPSDLAPLPDNVLALRWAPQLRVLAESDAVIAHGGSGTLREAIHFGVPSVVYPTGHGANDQFGTAQRVAHHRLGVLGDADRDGPAEVDAAVSLVLSDSTIRRAVDDMAAVFRTYDDEHRAVAEIERLLHGAASREPDRA